MTVILKYNVYETSLTPNKMYTVLKKSYTNLQGEFFLINNDRGEDAWYIATSFTITGQS
jgi:hypothetical protein